MAEKPTPQEIDRVRRAISALQSHRSGSIPLSESSFTLAFDIVTEAAQAANIDVETAISEYDPDQRIGSVPLKATLKQTLLDLDESERHRAVILIKRLESKTQATDDDTLHTLWAIAHDQAIVEVTHARATGRLNGIDTWASNSWGDRKG